MPLLADWKTAKKKFEAKTKRKKPSEKVMGVFGKSSGIEGSLKLLDAAIAKKMPQLLPKLLSQWMKVYTAYKKTMEAAIKKEGSPDYSKDVTNILGVFLTSVSHEIARQEAALWKDDDTVMTFEEAVGSHLFSEFLKDPVVKFKPLQIWLADIGSVAVGPTVAIDAESVKCTAVAKKHFKQRLMLLKEWSGLKSKTMKRSVAIQKAKRVCREFNVTWLEISEKLPEWGYAQQEFVEQLGKQYKLSKKATDEDFKNMVKKSTTWKALESMSTLTHATVAFESDLDAELRKI